MPISLVHWSVNIEVFNLESFIRLAKYIFSANFRTTVAKHFFMLPCGIALLIICADVGLKF